VADAWGILLSASLRMPSVYNILEIKSCWHYHFIYNV